MSSRNYTSVPRFLADIVCSYYDYEGYLLADIKFWISEGFFYQVASDIEVYCISLPHSLSPI